LVAALLGAGSGFRLRLSSTELCPELVRVVELMAGEPRLCRFLHLPIQHGADRILRAMSRPYTVAEFAETVRMAHRRVPGICLGTDVIAGFPGEGDADFAQCVDTIRDLPFGLLHVFRYSRRPGTPAAEMPDQVPGEVASRRAAVLAGLGRSKSAEFAQTQVGRVVRVLTENVNARGNREGWSDNYLRTELCGDRWPRNCFVDATVESVTEGRHVKAENPRLAFTRR
jgi:threonylcarbamoyladenosine tRNA methylthiotransferase MtaB